MTSYVKTLKKPSEPLIYDEIFSTLTKRDMRVGFFTPPPPLPLPSEHLSATLSIIISKNDTFKTTLQLYTDSNRLADWFPRRESWKTKELGYDRDSLFSPGSSRLAVMFTCEGFKFFDSRWKCLWFCRRFVPMYSVFLKNMYRENYAFSIKDTNILFAM